MNIFQKLLRPGVYTERQTGLRFPAELAGLKRGKVLPDPVADTQGVIIAYGLPRSTQATVYVFSRVGVTVPDGGDSGAVAAELEQATQAVSALESNGIYSSVQWYEGTPEPLGASSSNRSWAKAAFTAVAKGQFFMSLIYITGFRGHFIKVRLSAGAPHDEGLETFPAALADLVDQQQ